ncbi:geranylgeranyl transferase type-1 subunit beta [Paragonimus westermani]|uniref:Geranylgeranyl transferase type-1 subunit beta n=1 Tax=Paragonimus westermani TaxID=34504 RepID=A0A5J4N951_9TREM|nr:geranylgeranyl transferase type-1 subunit beta [Paragonimus westermani]
MKSMELDALTNQLVTLWRPIAALSLCDHSHVTMVYAALCILVTLGDDLSRVDRLSVLTGIAALQCSDEPGLFSAGLVCPERDIRFVFSAVASCYILNGLDILDTEAVVEFIGKCLTYEGGFACLPHLETHAGATYCALASLTLLNRLHSFLPVGSRPRDRLIRWLSSLQSEGFHGRLHKSDDTCYTFWVCASLQLLGCKHVNDSGIVQFIARSWDTFSGGIKKFPDLLCHSDPLHTHLALSGLSCLKAVAESRCRTSPPNSIACAIPCSGNQQFSDNHTDVCDQFSCLYSEHLGSVQPELNISRRAYVYLQAVRERWQRFKGGSIA